MLNYTMKLTKTEVRITKAIANLQYGTLKNIEVPEDEERAFETKVSQSMRALINTIRDGYCHIEQIVVHQSDPSYMEVVYTSEGIPGIKRFKFQ